MTDVNKLDWAQIWEDRYFLILQELKDLANPDHQLEHWSEYGPHSVVEYYSMLFDDYHVDELVQGAGGFLHLPAEHRDALARYARHFERFMEGLDDMHLGPKILLALDEWKNLVVEARNLVATLPSAASLRTS